MTDELPAGYIEVGQNGADLRYWLAKEAVRQGEAYLQELSASADGLISRAVAILGWGVTVSLASIGVLVSGRLPVPAGLAASAALMAACLAIAAAWPRHWEYRAIKPAWFLDGACGATSELQCLESIATGLQNAIRRNARRASRRSNYLRASWLALAAAPVLAGAAWAAQTILASKVI